VGTIICRWCGRRQPDAPPDVLKAQQQSAAGRLGRYNRELTGAGLTLMGVVVVGLVWVAITRFMDQPPAARSDPPTAVTSAVVLTLTAFAERTLVAAATPTALSLTATSTPTVPTPVPTTAPTETAPATTTPSETPSQAATQTPLPPGELPQAVVKVAALALRAAPGHPVALAFVRRGEKVTVLGRARGQAWVLARHGSTLEGWMEAGPTQLELELPLEALPVIYFQPATGIISGNRAMVGHGALVIRADPELDGVVILAQEGLAISAVYVRAGEYYNLARVPDGIYTLYRVSGSDWDGFEFATAAEHERYDELFVFKTSRSSYTIWRIDLDPDVEQDHIVSAVAPEDVPAVVPDTLLE
jgi:hypothetical protein